MELRNAFLKARVFAYVVLRGGGNGRIRGTPPTIDGRPQPCHMLIPGFEPRAAAVTSEYFTTTLPRLVHVFPRKTIHVGWPGDAIIFVLRSIILQHVEIMPN